MTAFSDFNAQIRKCCCWNPGCLLSDTILFNYRLVFYGRADKCVTLLDYFERALTHDIASWTYVHVKNNFRLIRAFGSVMALCFTTAPTLVLAAFIYTSAEV